MAPLSNRARPPARISLTPLIDVVFILLVFLMLASKFFDWRAIPLQASGSGAGDAMRGALMVEVTPQGPRLAGEALSLPELTEQLRTRRANDPEQPILILPREDVETGALVAVLDRLAAEGLRNLTLIGAGQ